MGDQLRGGCTIGGYLALHSGLTSASLAGDFSIGGVLNVSKDIKTLSLTSTNSYFLADAPAIQEAGIRLQAAGVDKWKIYNPASSDDLRFYSTVDRVTITTAGNITAVGFTGPLTGNASTATKLASTVTINGTNFDGSANITITANTTNTLTRGSYLTGNNFNGSAATTWAVDATSANTVSKVVVRDGNGDFAGRYITATQFKCSATSGKPLDINSGCATTVVDYLNADLLDGYHASDIFNCSINAGGYGVISGCEVTAGLTSKTVTVANGKLYIKNYGYKNFTQETTPESPFTAGYIHYVFISGHYEAGIYTIGGLAVISDPSEDALILNKWSPVASQGAILLAKVTIPAGVSVILDAYIKEAREFVPIITDNVNKKVIIFKSDKSNATIASTSHNPFNRMEIYKDGDKTKIVMNDVPAANGSTKSMTIDTDKISFYDSTETLTIQDITYSKVETWDEAGTKKHTHYYDAAFAVGHTPDGARVAFTLASGHSLNSSSVRVYKNGLRQKLTTDYTVSSATITFVAAPIATDTIALDYDLG